MSSGRGGLSKLGTALTIIFVIALVALFIEIFYVLWRRRVFRRQNPTVLQGGCGGGDQLSQYSSDCSVSSTASSKELLYFFCIRPRETNSNTDGPNSNAPPQMDIDVLKLQGMHGPSRFLFTINEEEREDFELPLAEKDQNQSETVSLEEGVNLTEESQEEFVVVVVAAAAAAAAEEAEEEVDHVRDIDATPFSTPCASPVYFTPSASPVHELTQHQVAKIGHLSTPNCRSTAITQPQNEEFPSTITSTSSSQLQEDVAKEVGPSATSEEAPLTRYLNGLKTSSIQASK
ncbi:Hypothetical predicted protein [Olea europaea subsp. europaea]|uniref:Uncharacterized protein n=1 Tax=Olea europaea subsp. europaea TaxID=158383 RepID=A0A8S0V2A7_OLEEU|nr:Hypothetical predicted protein [Olea europaea subsp. europaea]